MDSIFFEGEPHNPISGQSGFVHELLAEVTDQEVAEWCRYWTWQMESYKAKGNGFAAWKCSIRLSSGDVEAMKRGFDAEKLRTSIQAALVQ